MSNHPLLFPSTTNSQIILVALLPDEAVRRVLHGFPALRCGRQRALGGTWLLHVAAVVVASDELAALLENCGITALDQVLKEILVEAPGGGSQGDPVASCDLRVVAPVDSSHLTLEEFRRVIDIIHVNEGFSSREIMKLKEVFRRFDLDRGGLLDTGELHKAMSWLGFAIMPEEVADISSTCDIGGKGQLEEHEFFSFMRKVKEREAPHDGGIHWCHGDRSCEDHV
eukprot:Skav225050  [mRNA]  locus=scaffold1570:89010:95680:- [translate_table: standard]